MSVENEVSPVSCQSDDTNALPSTDQTPIFTESRTQKHSEPPINWVRTLVNVLMFVITVYITYHYEYYYPLVKKTLGGVQRQSVSKSTADRLLAILSGQLTNFLDFIKDFV